MEENDIIREAIDKGYFRIESSPSQLSIENMIFCVYSEDVYKKSFPHTFFKENNKRTDKVKNRCKR